ncbi:MAG TPA: FAD-linked oxidase C-terminal domain-containing protein [Thermoanaerobaculia bacterium]|jgi:FAD/FMN-containing dehydrogenase/Fe-S oxidoreductase|nr:FAD-linked oxidase C-terminal domain-containing protein [Thermoanaerobaculia bacterium]
MIRRENPWPGDTTALEDDLRRSLRGEVRFDAGHRALYATDASNYRQVPIGVVVPVDDEDLIAAVAACRRYRAPIVHRGAGTSLAGQCCNVAVVIDASRHLTGVREIDPVRRIARVRPGTVLDDLRRDALRHGLTFGPDPATHGWCTVGGMIGNNSCGVHSLTTGRTSDNVEELEILTYDGLRLRVGATPEAEIDRIVRSGGRRGEIYRRLRELRDRYAGLIRERFPQLSRRVSGFNLDDLLPERGFHVARALAGTEGTCVTFLEATVRLTPAPKARVLAVLGYPDVVRAAESVPEVLAAGPIGLEGMDRFLVDNEFTRRSYPETLALLPPGDAWLLVEFGGESREEALERARQLSKALLVEAPAEQARIWQVREAAVATTSRDPRLGDGWPGWEDSAVPPERLAPYLRDLLALLARHGLGAALYGHFGEGCLHARIDFDFRAPEGIRTYRTFVEEAADLVVAHGGSLSGEHGDGQQRGELLPRMFGEELVQAFREFKAIWDPGNRMNPGKKVDPYPLDADLRPALRLADPPVAFRFPRDIGPGDAGGFARAVTRCVGVGKCRREAGGIMCPSFQATREEQHSTRGRARLLFEMLEGGVIRDGWRSEEVHEALDLCLACKGCRAECPAGVDMASYKAEFLHHHYAGRPRPRPAYAMGLIPWWARLASRFPGMANGLTQGPFSGILKKLGGVHPDRRLPTFARRTFRDGFAARSGTPTVLLWPDTFTNFFQPHIAHAAVAVLEAAGHRVGIPRQVLCCGRPLYDFGMLDLARRQLRQILTALRPEIEAGLPVVGLEPSCVAVFRDELVNLFPEDEAARRLSAQTFTLAEFLVREGFEPLRRSGEAIVQGHCHHHSVMGLDADRTLLGKLGLDFKVLDAGCCGMAGAFGFEADHYEVSLAVAGQALLPAVRAAGPDVAILADGFSCREQISQLTGRRPRHLAEVLAAALLEEIPGGLS